MVTLRIVILLHISGIMDAIIVVLNLYVNHNWFTMKLPQSDHSIKEGNVDNKAQLHIRILDCSKQIS